MWSYRLRPVTCELRLNCINLSFIRCKSRKGTKAAHAIRLEMAAMEEGKEPINYTTWSHESLIERVSQLERELNAKNTHHAKPPVSTSPNVPHEKKPSPSATRNFDPSKYHTRLVAFKLSYLGKNFNGFENHVGNQTPLPTIEEELWKAFMRARLIFPDESRGKPGEVNWEGCEYSKCGRTDRGVSAFGQVIGLRVRSNKPMIKSRVDMQDMNGSTEAPFDSSENDQKGTEWDSVDDEIQYAKLLNNLLPPEIRILAWCPHPPENFSARFFCRERQYRYFFTQPAFSPVPTSLEESPSSCQKDGWLNIPAMREAAKHYIGEHDFRNLCKIDASKQITNFKREVFFADIIEVADSTSALHYVNEASFQPSPSVPDAPKVYAFVLHGSAFLWHQVRHMVAVLFRVGQGLESPSIITKLLDVTTMPTRPKYEMAIDTPLVLWDCIFPDITKETETTKAERIDTLGWHYVGTGPGSGEQKYGSPGLMEDLWEVWREKKVDEMLASQLLGVVAAQGPHVDTLTRGRFRKAGKSQKVFDGDNRPRLKGTYQSIEKSERMEGFEVSNERYAKKKGFASSEEMKILGYRGQGTGGKEDGGE